MRRVILFLGIAFTSHSLQAQDPYKFKEEINLNATPVISQGFTGTCWSFSTSSFLESEIIRLTGKQIDLSEMYNVRHTYVKKANNYVMRQGMAQFAQGALAHDVINSIKENGLVPNEVYSGLYPNEAKHNHAELELVVKAMLDTYIKKPGGELSNKWGPAVEAVLDTYLGKKVNKFTYEGKEYTPQSFLEITKIQPDNYVSIASFSHAKFYDQFILNVPDNFSNGSFYNVPLDEMIATLDNALKNGYTVELDCDMSEKTFSSKDGIAVIPEDEANNEKALKAIYPEKKITQEYRQQEFENYNTTDDHLMHITGVLKDQKGNKYYKVKNSWGSGNERTTNGGYMYFSESYMRLKAISIMVHKDAVPKKILNNLKI